jgi:hypothetical protein
MTRPKEIGRLAELAQLMLDHRLGQLRASSTVLDRSRMQLASINQAARPSDLMPVTAEKVALAYDRWADVRRSELNLVIARQTVDWMQARSEAQTAFGRLQALQGVAGRLEKKT